MKKEINLISPEFKLCSVLGEPAIFSDLRFNVGAMPEGLYMYQLRHSDDGEETYCEIARYISCNMSGTIFTKNPLYLGPNGFVDLNNQNNTIGYFDAKSLSMKEFMDSFIFRVTLNGRTVQFRYFQTAKSALEYAEKHLEITDNNKTNRILLSTVFGEQIKIIKWWDKGLNEKFSEVKC